MTTSYFDNVGNISSLTNTTPAADAGFQYDSFNRLTKATYPEKVYDYTYDPFGNMLTAQENSIAVFSKTYTAVNRVSGLSYDGRGNLTQDESFAQVWDKRNRLSESRVAATNALLGSYVYNERGLRVKAERSGQPAVQVVRPNGGESLYLGAMDTISWNGMGLAGALVKLELLVGGTVTGTIVENLPGTQTTYQWQVGKTLTGWVNPGSDYKVRVTAVVPPAASGTTYYFYDSGGKLLAEYDSTGTCVKDYLYLGGKMIGEFVPSAGSYYYYASDQINSTRLVTDATGGIVHSAQYDPYGGLYKTWVDTYHPKPGFSGKEREFGSEMDYFGARYYGHRQYRFLSVDPVINKDDAVANPQLWNLYAYCQNSPMTYLDLNGAYAKDVHEDLTKYLALQAGFSESESKKIAFANQWTDENPGTSASYFYNELEQRKTWHFASNEQAAAHLAKAFDTRDLFDLGMALHCLQDSMYAHKAYRKSARHALESLRGDRPDDPSSNVGMALQMAQNTLDILNVFRGSGFKKIDQLFLQQVFSIKSQETRSKMLNEKR